MYDNIRVTVEKCIAKIELNRPEKLNAFIGHMRRDLAQALERAASDRGIRVVVVTGAGRGFCAGADVAYMDELMERQDVEEFARLLGAGRRVVTAIRQMTKPVIASVNGVAYGAGFNLALA
ncbi:MAG TPA: enoyl-CoA hydratase/isomerase family protein, partial [Pyrinomonadaceae bacterium]